MRWPYPPTVPNSTHTLACFTHQHRWSVCLITCPHADQPVYPTCSQIPSDNWSWARSCDHVKKTGLPVSNSESPLFEVIRNLAALEGQSSTQVLLKAREVLIAGQMLLYEECLIQIEGVLKASLGNTYYGESGLSQSK